MEPILPEMAASFVHSVYVLGVDEICSADGFGERGFCVRDADDVDVVGHEAIALDLEAVFLRLLAEKFAVDVAVVVDEEYILAVVAALSDVVRGTGYYDSGLSRHACKYMHETALCQEK